MTRDHDDNGPDIGERIHVHAPVVLEVVGDGPGVVLVAIPVAALVLRVDADEMGPCSWWEVRDV